MPDFIKKVASGMDRDTGIRSKISRQEVLRMKKSKFTEKQIVFALRQAESGTRVSEVCRKMGIAEQTFFRWKKKYGGLGFSELRRLRQLEEETGSSSAWWRT
jgi:putative transposase